MSTRPRDRRYRVDPLRRFANVLWARQERALRVFGTFAAAGVVAGTMIAPAAAADISGAGATFPYPIYAKWAEASRKETGIGVSYQPIGSADGIRQIQGKEVTFAATDMPLPAADLEAGGLLQDRKSVV